MNTPCIDATGKATPPVGKTARLQASALLRLPGLRIHLVLTAILCLCFWTGIVYICECVFAAVPWATLSEQSPLWYEILDQAFYYLDVVVIVLVGIPLLYGACMIFAAAVDGQKAPMTTLFCGFAGPRAYARALGIMLGMLLPALAIAAGILYLVRLTKNGEMAELAWLYYALIVLLPLVICLLSGAHDGALRLSYLRPDMSAHRIFAASRRAAKGRLAKLFLFKLSYLAWAVLSVLSLGIVLIFHALPSFALAYTLYLNSPNETNTST